MILLVCQMASGGISLPLNGACKAGRFFPVSVESVDRVTLEAPGCLPVEVSAENHRMTAAVLVTGTPNALRCGPQSLPLHLVGDDEVLIGSVDPAADLSTLFPGKRVTSVRLDPTDPFPGPPVAWEILDAAFLDGPSLSRLSDRSRSALLSGGVKIVSAGTGRPDDRWPWTRQDPWWVLSARPVGPAAELINSDAYSPVSAWSPGRPARVRTGMVTGTILLSLTVVAVCLWRSRWRVVVAGLILIAASGIVVTWRTTLSPAATDGGDVVVADGPLVQRDSWVFYRGLDSGSVLVSFQGWTHPVFSSNRAMTAANLRLVESGTSTAFSMPMENDRLMGFVHREIAAGPMPEVNSKTSSTTADLAKAVYSGPGYGLAGQSPTAAGRWPTAVVRGR